MRTLMATDNSKVGEFVGRVLAAEGIEVLPATSVSALLEAVRNRSADAVFLDLGFCGGRGLEILKQMFQLRPSLPVLALVSNVSEPVVNELNRLGVCACVRNWLDRSEIVAALGTVHTRIRRHQHSPAEGVAKSVAMGHPSQKPVAESLAMRTVLTLAAKIAPTNLPVLIQGESGVGKKLIARRIHQHYHGTVGAFVHVACAALRETAAESRLSRWPESCLDASLPPDGPTELGRTTLFLEEVNELPIWAQTQLLDTFDGISPVALGRNLYQGRNVRVIASTSIGLEDAMSQGRFHRGLYDFLNVAPIKVPPLRARRQDIRPLVAHFCGQYSGRNNSESEPFPVQFSDATWKLLLDYAWPGNVRELATVLARAMFLQDDTNIDMVLAASLRNPAQTETGEMITVPLAADMKVIEWHIVREVVRRHGGNKAAAARALGLHRRTLYRMLEKKSRPQDTGIAVEPACVTN